MTASVCGMPMDQLAYALMTATLIMSGFMMGTIRHLSEWVYGFACSCIVVSVVCTASLILAMIYDNKYLRICGWTLYMMWILMNLVLIFLVLCWYLLTPIQLSLVVMVLVLIAITFVPLNFFLSTK